MTTTSAPPAADLLRHGDPPGPHHRAYQRLLRVLASFPDTAENAWRAGVLTNMFAVVTRGAAEDYERVAVLVRTDALGVAAIQDELDGLLGTGPNRPLTTAAVLRLARSGHIRSVVLEAGRAEADAEQVAAMCADAAFWLLLAGVDVSDPLPVPQRSQELRGMVEHQGVATWRGLLANVAGNPFGPDARRLAELAIEADLDVAARAAEACARFYRKRAEDEERLAVANEIRRLVALSGCSQRSFAQYVGTSAPRMSTYVNGVVTPSATMLFRIRKSASRLARAQV